MMMTFHHHQRSIKLRQFRICFSCPLRSKIKSVFDAVIAILGQGMACNVFGKYLHDAPSKHLKGETISAAGPERAVFLKRPRLLQACGECPKDEIKQALAWRPRSRSVSDFSIWSDVKERGFADTECRLDKAVVH